VDDLVSLSRGITLRDLYNHMNLKQMIVDGNDFVVENIRGEQFRFSPVETEALSLFTRPPSNTLITLGMEWPAYSGELVRGLPVDLTSTGIHTLKLPRIHWSSTIQASPSRSLR
jgi:hypothetical protein